METTSDGKKHKEKEKKQKERRRDDQFGWMRLDRKKEWMGQRARDSEMEPSRWELLLLNELNAKRSFCLFAQLNSFILWLLWSSCLAFSPSVSVSLSLCVRVSLLPLLFIFLHLHTPSSRSFVVFRAKKNDFNASAYVIYYIRPAQQIFLIVIYLLSSKCSHPRSITRAQKKIGSSVHDSN